MAFRIILVPSYYQSLNETHDESLRKFTAIIVDALGQDTVKRDQDGFTIIKKLGGSKSYNFMTAIDAYALAGKINSIISASYGIPLYPAIVQKCRDADS